MNLLIMGRPGAGKGTQAEYIKDYYKVLHISTGDMFRKAIADGTKLGLEAKSYMDKGALVPDSVTIGVVRERLSCSDVKEKGFLLDGFPRTLEQAEALSEILKDNNLKLDAVLDVNVDVDVITKRMVGRRVCKDCKKTFNIVFDKSITDKCPSCGGDLYQRTDDNEETVVNRLNVYEKQTAPVLNYYAKQNILKTVNGDQSVDKVFSDIKSVLGE